MRERISEECRSARLHVALSTPWRLILKHAELAGNDGDA
jgi:hypothetical protein